MERRNRMEDEQFEVKYENAELRYYDRETFEHNRESMRNVFLIPHGLDGKTFSGSALVLRYSLRDQTLLDTVYFYAKHTVPILADEVGAQLWEVHEQYKRRIL